MIFSSILVLASSGSPIWDGGVRVRSEITQSGDQLEHDPRLQSRLGLRWGKNQAFGGRLVLQDARRLSEMTTSQAGELMLHEGYVRTQLLKGIRLDAGRRELSLGSGRLVSAAPWSDNGRAFDGVFLTVKDPRYPLGLTAWASQPGTPGSLGKRFAGVYIERSFNPSLHWEAWWIRSQTLSTQSDRHTLGSAMRLRYRNAKAELEGSYQFGDHAERTIAAWGAALQAQWRANHHQLKPLVGAELNLASGDSDAADPIEETFDPLYAAAHRYWGHLDLIGGRNATDLHLYAGTTLAKTNLSIHGHLLSLQSETDDFYLHNGSGRGLASNQATGRDVGTEIDLMAEKKIRLLKIKFGLSVFLPGSVAKRSDLGDDLILGGYLQLESRFK